MGASSRMLMASLGAIWCICCCYVYIIIVGPLFNTLIPVVHTNTAPVYWSMLGGDAMLWIVPFIYTIIVLCGLLAIIRMIAEATVVVDYDTGGF